MKSKKNQQNSLPDPEYFKLRLWALLEDAYRGEISLHTLYWAADNLSSELCDLDPNDHTCEDVRFFSFQDVCTSMWDLHDAETRIEWIKRKGILRHFQDEIYADHYTKGG